MVEITLLAWLLKHQWYAKKKEIPRKRIRKWLAEKFLKTPEKVAGKWTVEMFCAECEKLRIR